jgi:hypothetical protein
MHGAAACARHDSAGALHNALAWMGFGVHFVHDGCGVPRGCVTTFHGLPGAQFVAVVVVVLVLVLVVLVLVVVLVGGVVVVVLLVLGLVLVLVVRCAITGAHL